MAIEIHLLAIAPNHGDFQSGVFSNGVAGCDTVTRADSQGDFLQKLQSQYPLDILISLLRSTAALEMQTIWLSPYGNVGIPKDTEVIAHLSELCD